MPKVFLATHDGHTFQRTSVRKFYTHAVLLIRDIAQARAACEASARKRWQKDDEYTKEVAAGTAEILKRWDFQSPEQHEARVEKSQREAREHLADPAQTEAAFVARWLADFDKWAVPISSDGLSYYSVAGWCSRLDLAEKKASSERSARHEYPLKEVMILQARVKEA